jgi:hypothetical protein
MSRLIALLRPYLLGLFVLCATAPAHAANSIPNGQLCDRDCLYAVLDQYLDALNDKDPFRLPWADDARFTENNVELLVGDGVWQTITKLGTDFKLRFADPEQGTVGYFGEVEESGVVSPFGLWMEVRDGKITKVETQVRRAADEALAAMIPKGEMVEKPILNEVMKPKDQLTREHLIALADGYFDTLQQNNGQLFTEFADDCERVENGLKTTHNDQIAAIPVARLGCAEQFKLGNFIYDDRLRGRRFPVVDVERGLVLAAGFIDHTGRIGKYTLTDGTELVSPIRRPHSFYLLELFKMNKKGQIQQIESIFMTVPYHMPSPWDQK